MRLSLATILAFAALSAANGFVPVALTRRNLACRVSDEEVEVDPVDGEEGGEDVEVAPAAVEERYVGMASFLGSCIDKKCRPEA